LTGEFSRTKLTHGLCGNLQDGRVDSAAATMDAYIAASPPAAQPALRRIREIVRGAAPDAEETISYRMPAFRGNGILVYFAAFKNHIGIFPPCEGDARLDEARARYRGPKGNLRFPLDEPIPCDLIDRIVRLRAKQDQAKDTGQKRSKRSRTSSRQPRSLGGGGRR
jgi:uncharacterized protein YdhG (YjbR/CyaY superfamily)